MVKWQLMPLIDPQSIFDQHVIWHLIDNLLSVRQESTNFHRHAKYFDQQIDRYESFDTVVNIGHFAYKLFYLQADSPILKLFCLHSLNPLMLKLKSKIFCTDRSLDVNSEVSWMQCKVVTCTTFLGAVPTFLKEPTYKITAIKGSTATFDCQIDVSQPSYHWLKDGTNITKGSISLSGSVSSLQIDNLAFSDSGNYSCVATDIKSSQRGKRTGALVVKGMLLILKLFRDCNIFRSAMWVK